MRPGQDRLIAIGNALLAKLLDMIAYSFCFRNHFRCDSQRYRPSGTALGGP